MAEFAVEHALTKHYHEGLKSKINEEHAHLNSRALLKRLLVS